MDRYDHTIIGSVSIPYQWVIKKYLFLADDPEVFITSGSVRIHRVNKTFSLLVDQLVFIG